MNKLSETLRLLPIILFIIGRFIFDSYSPCIGEYAEIMLIDDSPTITHWQLFYYIVLDLSWIAYLTNLIIQEHRNNHVVFLMILGAHFIADIIIQLRKVGMSFGEYVKSTTSIEQDILMSGLMSSLLIVFLVKMYFSQRKKEKR